MLKWGKRHPYYCNLQQIHDHLHQSHDRLQLGNTLLLHKGKYLCTADLLVTSLDLTKQVKLLIFLALQSFVVETCHVSNLCFNRSPPTRPADLIELGQCVGQCDVGRRRRRDANDEFEDVDVASEVQPVCPVDDLSQVYQLFNRKLNLESVVNKRLV